MYCKRKNSQVLFELLYLPTQFVFSYLANPFCLFNVNKQSSMETFYGPAYKKYYRYNKHVWLFMSVGLQVSIVYRYIVNVSRVMNPNFLLDR